jgi:hypothetical protein
MTEANAQWWYERNGAQAGPVAFSVLQSLAATGDVRPSTMVWTAGMPGWARAETIPGLDWPGSQVAAEGGTPSAPAPALGAPPPFFGRSTPPPAQAPSPAAGGAPTQTWAPPRGGAVRTAAEGVQEVGEINVTTTILLSIVTLGIYGVVKFFQTGRAYERLVGRETRFTTYFWVFVGTAVGAVVMGGVSDALRWPLGVASVVFQFLTLNEALKARDYSIQRWGLGAAVTKDTTHYVLLALGLVLAWAVVGIVLLIIQGVKWFQDWNAVRAAAMRRPVATQSA